MPGVMGCVIVVEQKGFVGRVPGWGDLGRDVVQN